MFWMLNGFALAVILLIGCAAWMKYRDFKAAIGWVKAPARIVTSMVEPRTIVSYDADDSDDRSNRTRTAHTRIENVARIEYQFQVGRKVFRGTRLALTDELAWPKAAAAVALYPAGRPIEIYYDPANPAKSVIDRTAPDGMFRAIAWVIGGLIVADLLANLMFGLGAGAIRTVIPNQRNAGMAVFLGCMAAFCALFAFAMYRQIAATGRWLRVTAEIVDPASRPELTTGLDPAGGWTVYRYRVNGLTFYGDSDSPASTNRATTPRRRTAPRRQPLAGTRIEIYVDPADPGRSFRSRGWGGLVFVTAVAAILAASAVTFAVLA